MNLFNCPNSSGKNAKENLDYNNDFRGTMEGIEDEEEGMEEMNYCSIGKKRRLSIDQVQALERIFEADNKLDPEKKIKLAQELGLQPRQVAIWFQNRRARWKTKQLERDYRLLKADYETLQLNFSKVEQEKEGLVSELRGLKEKLGEENAETSHSAEKPSSSPHQSPQRNHKIYRNINLSEEMKRMKEFKEGLSSDDSDSSGILNEDNYLNSQPRLTSSCSTFEEGGMDQYSVFPFSTPPLYHPLMDYSSRGVTMMKGYYEQQQQQQQQQFGKMEEDQNFFTADDDEYDSCNMFQIDQTPFFWHFSDQRN